MSTSPPIPDIVRLEPGDSTSSGLNLEYRLSKLQDLGLIQGDWLDCGCGDGTYTEGLKRRGASNVVGIDVIAERVQEAKMLWSETEGTSFILAESEHLPFDDATFDGIFMNEVFEHVADEALTLREAYRILRPGKFLVLISPNRGFPFEGHGIRIGQWTLDKPTPLIPWLPQRLTSPLVRARNYWPAQLHRHIEDAGFDVYSSGPVLPVLEYYPWAPKGVITTYQQNIRRLENTPLLRHLGVSTIVIGRKPGDRKDGSLTRA